MYNHYINRLFHILFSNVKWIYKSLQKWFNDVYYKNFQHYPRLYIHGISRGSRIATLFCRVLSIQQQILTIYSAALHQRLFSNQYIEKWRTKSIF